MQVSTAVDEAGRLDPSQSAAVLIGVAEYPRSDYPSVPAAYESVRRLAAELADEQVWGIPREFRLVVLADPDRATVLGALATASQLVGRQGMLLVYFVGHAETVGTELCLAMRDADRSNPTETMLTVSALVAAAAMGGSRSDKRMLMLDCCYSGRAASWLPGVSVKAGETAGWYFIGASDGGTEASAPSTGETTLFTAAALKVMQGSPSWDERLTPAAVWREVSALLPAEPRPVHNDTAWAHELLWLRNRGHVPRPRFPIRLPDFPAQDIASADSTPAPPALYARPPYIRSHAFTGRASQLETLDDWASSSQPYPVLLFEAIGGTGKSVLTWEWITNNAANLRDDWAGRFWYSFYEKGAVMADFCRHALAYMTGNPAAAFNEFTAADLIDKLLHHMQDQPWLIVLDGLERVLVAYHRSDASQLPDEQAGQTDEIATRDPCSAILPRDDELLRRLAAAIPSKVLITSRLTPRVLLNAANQPIPGVLIERLPGLRPSDAELLLRSCGVSGDSRQMQDFLQRHCDCHPLVIGVIAGLVNAYLPARGNFDRWASDPANGGQLDLGNLDLVQKQKHILSVALQALPDAGRRLLFALSLLRGAVDYPVLDALNPHRPRPPREVAEPPNPVAMGSWDEFSEEQQATRREWFERSLAARRDYERKYEQWKASSEVQGAAEALAKTVTDLERRGLLQYDRQAGRWDLHPVVRASAKARLPHRDRETLGQQIIEYFSQRDHNPYDEAQCVEDLDDALTVVHAMIDIGRIDDAWSGVEDLGDILLFDLEAYSELAAILRPMFSRDWSAPLDELPNPTRAANYAAYVLRRLELYRQSAHLHRFVVGAYIREENWPEVQINILNLAVAMNDLNEIAASERYTRLSLELAEVLNLPGHLLHARAEWMAMLGMLGRYDEAEQVWGLLEQMSRDVPRRIERAGAVEMGYLSWVKFPLGRLTEDDLVNVEELVAAGRSRQLTRRLHFLQGRWRLRNNDPTGAVRPLQEAVRMANESGILDRAAEAWLALAELRSRSDYEAVARDIALHLAAHDDPPHHPLALIWQALGDNARATIHARAAYARAWADGQPYVYRFALTEAAALLHNLGAQPPTLPPYDPTGRPIEDWEHEVTAAIADRRAS